jgi:predicted nucleic acid-binding protein
MMHVLLDTNVILDAMLQRTPWHGDTDAILHAAGRGEVRCAVTTLSIANLFYIGRRIVGVQQARSDVRTCLNTLQILAVDRQVLIDADTLAGSNFEDNIQIAAAVVVAERVALPTCQATFTRRSMKLYAQPDSFIATAAAQQTNTILAIDLTNSEMALTCASKLLAIGIDTG